MHFLIINIFKQKLYPLSLVLSFLLLLLIHSFLQSFEFVDDFFNIYLFVLFLITIILSRILCFSKQDKEVVMNLLDKIKK